MSAPSSKLPATLARTLDQVRQGQLAMKLAEFPILLVAGIAAAGCFQALADRVFDLPWAARLLLLLADFGAIGWLAWRHAMIPWLKRLDRKGAALLVEREIPDLRSSLISTVELSSPGSSVPPQSQLLVKQLVANTAAKVKDLKVFGDVVRPDRVKKLAKWMLGPVVLALVLLILGWPVSGLLVKRIFLSSQPLPSATSVVSVTTDFTVEEGDEVVLTARATGVIPSDGRLIVMRKGRPDDSILVTPAKPGAAEFTTTLKNVREPFRYRFELNDGTGKTHAVAVHTPPAIKDIRFYQIYPGYTRLPEQEMKNSSLKLLEGSTLRIQGSATKPLDSGSLTLLQAEGPLKLGFIPEKDGQAFSIKLPETEPAWKSLSVHLTGAEKDESAKDPVYPIQVVADRPPQVTLSQPRAENITVVGSETVTISGNVVDDFGLAWVRLYYRVLRPKADGTFDDGGRSDIPFPLKPDEKSSALHYDWNLGRLNPPLVAGSRVVFWIEARDSSPATGARAKRNPAQELEPGATRTPERTITIVSEDEKRMELLDEFGRKAEEIERLYDTQRQINDRINLPRR